MDFFLGKDGEFSGNFLSAQAEGGHDLKISNSWGYNKEKGLSYKDGYFALGKPGVETSLGSGGLMIGIQEDIGSSFGYLKTIGGAYTLDIRLQFKITLK